MKRLAQILLGIWLIIHGLMSLASFGFSGSSTILALLAIAAGVLFFLGDHTLTFSARAADVVLGIWLVAGGLFTLFDIRFRGSSTVLDVLMLAAGVLILIRRS